MLDFAGTFPGTMQQGLGFRLVLWKGDLNMQHFPGISCRDDLKMLIYQGCSARMIQILVFFSAGGILHAKFSKRESAPKMQLQNLPLQSHEAAGLSQGSPLSIVFSRAKTLTGANHVADFFPGNLLDDFKLDQKGRKT